VGSPLGLKLPEVFRSALGGLAPADPARVGCHKGIRNWFTAVRAFQWHALTIQRALLKVKADLRKLCRDFGGCLVNPLGVLSDRREG